MKTRPDSRGCLSYFYFCSTGAAMLPVSSAGRMSKSTCPRAASPDPHRTRPGMMREGWANLAFGAANLERDRIYALVLDECHGRLIEWGAKSFNKALHECRDAHNSAWLAE